MTQKQGLKNVLDSISNTYLKYRFIYEWLEDINWHPEARLIAERHLTDEDNRRYQYHTQHLTERPHEEKYVDYYHAFNMIFGWGLDNDWESDSGEELVKEIESLIETKTA